MTASIDSIILLRLLAGNIRLYADSPTRKPGLHKKLATT
jgi:hypothetical protein